TRTTRPMAPGQPQRAAGIPTWRCTWPRSPRAPVPVRPDVSSLTPEESHDGRCILAARLHDIRRRGDGGGGTWGGTGARRGGGSKRWPGPGRPRADQALPGDGGPVEGDRREGDVRGPSEPRARAEAHRSVHEGGLATERRRSAEARRLSRVVPARVRPDGH